MGQLLALPAHRQTRIPHNVYRWLLSAPIPVIACRRAASPLSARQTPSKPHPTCRSRPTCTRATSPTSLTRSRRREMSRECQPLAPVPRFHALVSPQGPPNRLRPARSRARETTLANQLGRLGLSRWVRADADAAPPVNCTAAPHAAVHAPTGPDITPVCTQTPNRTGLSPSPRCDPCQVAGLWLGGRLVCGAVLRPNVPSGQHKASRPHVQVRGRPGTRPWAARAQLGAGCGWQQQTAACRCPKETSLGAG